MLNAPSADAPKEDFLNFASHAAALAALLLAAGNTVTAQATRTPQPTPVKATKVTTVEGISEYSLPKRPPRAAVP